MAGDPIFMDGFDMYNGTGALIGVESRWIANPLAMAGLIITTSTVAGRFAGQAVHINDSRSVLFNSNLAAVYGTPLPTTYTQLTWCGALRCTTLGFLRAPFFDLYKTGGSGGRQVTGYVDNLGAINFYNGDWGTFLGATAPSTILANNWHFIQIEVVFDATVGRLTLYVDGAQILNLTNKNTNPRTALGADYLLLSSFNNNATNVQNIPYDVDDLHILNSASTIEECWIETLRPNGDTITKDWVPDTGAVNNSRVNEAVVNGDTSYVSTATPGAKDYYSITPLSSTPLHIYAVQPVFFADKTDATTRVMRENMISGLTTSNGPNVNLSANYSRYNPRMLLLNPDGSVAWTPSAVNNLLIGPELIS